MIQTAWPPECGHEKASRVESRFDDCEANASIGMRVGEPLTGRPARGGYGGIGRFLSAEKALIREGLTPPLAKRDRGCAHDPGEPTEDRDDAFRRLIARAEHRPVDHHQHRQNPDQIPRVRDDHIDLLARCTNRKCPTGGRAQKKPGRPGFDARKQARPFMVKP
jgi:hypothetical protein